MDLWKDFFAAQVGATAALAGLLFVALSINIKPIIENPALPNRAAQSLAVLMTALVLASLELIPQDALASGIEILAVAVFGGIVNALLARGQFSVPKEHRGHMLLNVALNGVFVVLTLAAAVATLEAGHGAAIAAAAIVYGLVYGVFNAWVLLVEILR